MTYTMDAQVRNVVKEFSSLYEKSKQLFEGLRNLPTYGNVEWRPYFGSTFEVYTKLWRFQQKHRAILEKYNGLKRWQIGEIACKIGQLYYNYYLRTSEPIFLTEALAFYQAIRQRKYFRVDEDTAVNVHMNILQKKLRFYARLTVVCLFLKKWDDLPQILVEFSRDIDTFLKMNESEQDQDEWFRVIRDLVSFVESLAIVRLSFDQDKECSEKLLKNNNNNNNPQGCKQLDLRCKHFLSFTLYPSPLPGDLSLLSSVKIQSTNNLNLVLTEAVLVSNSYNQIRFNEITIDLYRMIQVLELPVHHNRDSLESDSTRLLPVNLTSRHLALGKTGAGKNEKDKEKMPPPSAVPGGSKGTDTDNAGAKKTVDLSNNPMKYILYKPTFAQTFNYISNAFHDLCSNGVLLLYFSADGIEDSRSPTHKEESAYNNGGLMTNMRKDANSSESDNNNNNSPSSNNSRDRHCIYPGDLFAFTRKPLFLIVDSDYCKPFKNFANLFDQPMVVLLAPDLLPASFLESRTQHGSLMTLFLYCPLSALCHVSDVKVLKEVGGVWQRLEKYLTQFMFEVTRFLTRSRTLSGSLYFMCNDVMLRTIVYRFIFMRFLLRLHCAFKGEAFYPSMVPSIDGMSELWESRSLTHIIMEMVTCLEAEALYATPVDMTSSTLGRSTNNA